MEVFCSSDGDQLLYSWTLNGEILEQGPMVGNTSIDLDERTDGNIICSVKNHVSHAQKTIRLEPCPAGEILHQKQIKICTRKIHQTAHINLLSSNKVQKSNSAKCAKYFGLGTDEGLSPKSFYTLFQSLLVRF